MNMSNYIQTYNHNGDVYHCIEKVFIRDAEHYLWRLTLKEPIQGEKFFHLILTKEENERSDLVALFNRHIDYELN